MIAQTLRVTIKQTDHRFRLLDLDMRDANNITLKVEIDGQEWAIVRRNRSWVPLQATEDSELLELAEAIGKSIALRYRI